MINKTFKIQGNGTGLYRVIKVEGLKMIEILTEYKFKTKDDARQYINLLCKVKGK